MAGGPGARFRLEGDCHHLKAGLTECLPSSPSATFKGLLMDTRGSSYGTVVEVISPVSKVGGAFPNPSLLMFRVELFFRSAGCCLGLILSTTPLAILGLVVCLLNVVF